METVDCPVFALDIVGTATDTTSSGQSGTAILVMVKGRKALALERMPKSSDLFSRQGKAVAWVVEKTGFCV